MEISIDTDVKAPLVSVWRSWVTPEDIIKWNFAADDWRCPSAEIDLVEGGKFSYRMEAKDGSMGFDFDGEFTCIEFEQFIEYKIGDGRKGQVEFIQTGDFVKVVERFEAENENTAEQQKQGWLCILSNFKQYVERKAS